MKKLITAFMLALLAVCAVFFIAACDKTPDTSPVEEPPAPPKKYTVTFVVDGVSTYERVEEGKMPVFTGSTDKEKDENGYYNFSGWDKEIVPVTENVTYTAQYTLTPYKEYTIRFVYQDENGQQKKETVKVKEGQIPDAPKNLPQYKTNTILFDFTGWSLPLEPLTEDFFNANKTGSIIIYNAIYSQSDRYYKVDFYDAGELIYTENLLYEAIPEYKGKEIKIPKGYNDYTWVGLVPVTQDGMRCELIFTYGNAQELEWAYNMDLLSFSSLDGDNDNRGNVIGEASAVLYMALEVRNAPDLTYAKRYRDRLVESLEFMVSDNGVAPFFDLEPYWCYVPLTAAITVCHATDKIWTDPDGGLSLRAQSKYDIVMKSFAYILTLGTADGNNYRTGPGLQGNFQKLWNPNYRLSAYIPMLFVGQYFGGAAELDKILKNFSFDKAVDDFAKYPCFSRAYKRWTTEIPLDDNGEIRIDPITKKPYLTGKEFMENGGDAYIFKIDPRLGYTGEGEGGGSGLGVKINYRVNGNTVDQIGVMMTWLLDYTFSGGTVWSDSKVLGADGIYPATADPKLVGTSKAYIMDGTESPVQGLDGLMKEFNGSDGGTKVNGVPTSQINGTNIRSSCTYNCHNFVMIISALSAFESLGVYSIDTGLSTASYKLMWVGFTDFLYKYEHGYMSYSLGDGYETKETREKNDGYFAWKFWWNTNYADNNPYA